PSRPRLPGPGDREGERGVLVLDRFPCGVRPADRLVERRTRAAEPLKEVDVSRAYAEAHGVVSSPRRRGEGLRHREELGWQLRISIGYTATPIPLSPLRTYGGGGGPAAIRRMRDRTCL